MLASMMASSRAAGSMLFDPSADTIPTQLHARNLDVWHPAPLHDWQEKRGKTQLKGGRNKRGGRAGGRGVTRYSSSNRKNRMHVCFHAVLHVVSIVLHPSADRTNTVSIVNTYLCVIVKATAVHSTFMCVYIYKMCVASSSIYIHKSPIERFKLLLYLHIYVPVSPPSDGSITNTPQFDFRATYVSCMHRIFK